jgi:3-hydroxybutyrate dehydrogenase
MLTGKVAIVTGSTSGIGLGIAHALAQQKAHVMLNGFGEQGAIDKLRKELAEQHGIKVGYSPADMSKPSEIRGMVEAAQRELGGLDISRQQCRHSACGAG